MLRYILSYLPLLLLLLLIDHSYGYTTVSTGSCYSGKASIASPTSSNVVLQFFALGDFPYDEESTTTVTGSDSKCGTSNSDAPKNADQCEYPPNSENVFACTKGCTYEGQEYSCWKDTIIPWMNDSSRTSSSTWVTEAKPAFSVHVGDFLKGNGSGNSGRCNPDSFASRRELFAGMYQ